jgi:hypothetical protein
MSRELEFRHKFGVFAAGAVRRSLIGGFVARSRDVGPVAAASFRVASRLANTLKGGYPVREPAALATARAILFYAPSSEVAAHLAILGDASLDWSTQALILCNCQADPEILAPFREKGASIASIRDFGVPGFAFMHGSGEARKSALRVLRLLHLRTIESAPDSEGKFDAAVTLATAAVTPLLDQIAGLLRDSGARDSDANSLAAALVGQTAREFSRSGRQSWEWHILEPEAQRLLWQIAHAGASAELLRELLLLGFDVFGKHKEVAEAIRQSLTPPPKSETATNGH